MDYKKKGKLVLDLKVLSVYRNGVSSAVLRCYGEQCRQSVRSS